MESYGFHAGGFHCGFRHLAALPVETDRPRSTPVVKSKLRFYQVLRDRLGRAKDGGGLARSSD